MGIARNLQASGWTRAAFGDATAALSRELASTEVKRALLEARAADLDDVSVHRFVAVLALLAHHERFGGLTGSQVTQLVTLATSILTANGIDPHTSRLSYLYGEVDLLAAALLARDGDHLAAALRVEEAFGRGRQIPEDRLSAFQLARAERAARLGQVRRALLSLGGLDEAAARMAMVRALRCSGRLLEAGGKLQKIADEALALDLGWESFALHAQMSGDLSPLVSAVGRGRPYRLPRFFLEATLWTRAVTDGRWLGAVPKLENLRRVVDEDIGRGSRFAVSSECVAQFERAADPDTPLERRIEHLHAVMPLLSRLPTLELELLGWLAVARTAGRMRQAELVAIAMEHYRGWSLRATDGARADALGLVTNETAARPPQSPIERAASLTGTAAGIAGIKLLGTLRRGADAREREDRAIAALLKRKLGSLRGPAVKIAQIAAYIVPGLSEPVRSALTSLQTASPTLPTDAVLALLAEAYGRPASEVFDSLSPEPIAAGSIGQIHRATLPDGRTVAVKVLFPAARAAIRADVRLLGLFGPIARRVFPSVDFKGLLRFLEKSLLEECDFVREGSHQQRMRTFFAEDPDLYVPETHADLGAPGVLVTEFVEGLSFEAFARSADETARVRAARAVARFAFSSALGARLVNGDPNPGNFVFQPDGRVACLDFGFAAELTPARAESWRSMWTAICDGDAASYGHAIREMGYVAGENFDFDSAWLAVQRASGPMFAARTPTRITHASVQESVEATATKSPGRAQLRLPLEDLHLQRSMLYYHWMLAELDVAVAWRDVVRPLLSAPSASPELPSRLDRRSS